MLLQIAPVEPERIDFVDELRKVDLTVADAQALHNAVVRFPVLVAHEQLLNDADHLRLTGYFGEISTYTALNRPAGDRNPVLVETGCPL